MLKATMLTKAGKYSQNYWRKKSKENAEKLLNDRKQS
jgi:hypothetical protein